MLDWFNLKDVCTTTTNGQTTIHIYLDENEKTPDERRDIRPNGFTRESTFHDFPIRGQEVLLHIRRRRWLDTEGHSNCLFPKGNAYTRQVPSPAVLP